MKTREQLIAECKAENPTMTQIINGEEVELNAKEYKAACEAWADMRLEQETILAKTQSDILAKVALLERLGISEDEAKLFLS